MINYLANIKRHGEQCHAKAALQEFWEQGRGKKGSFRVGWRNICSRLLSPTVVITDVEPIWAHLTPLTDMHLFERTENGNNLITAFSVHVREHVS